MPTLLHLDSSADLAASRSRALTAVFADAWRARGADHTVTYRDLHVHPLPHLEASALHWPAAERRPGADVPAGSQELLQSVVDELLAADVLLVGAPLYNYSLPSTLKTWIDRVHLPGVLVPDAGSTGPLAGRPAVVVVTRGGAYDAGTPTEGSDHGTPVLELILGTALGMDVHTVTASTTLAETVPALAPYRERARAEFADAERELARLGSTLA
ncbi:FMN-dependent NADH-azoreductase [Curtobacterium sp. MCBD17_019]|uniref:FMN-dependent NADH-azoreductase n=1 Tax=Curtobacterium sp. MCBD17_019 TaxID=2175669 RepID=UPI000DA88245|nr:NAD(P)H-dependent oxidoreductase [Curtobacterium sp. MCBD17_019]PZE76734.1 FMN-dependent NADH-azoreductase [Curtobacterium sp. MCBD17_019]